MKRIVASVVVGLAAGFVQAQDTVTVSLHEAIRIGTSQSVEYQVARNEYISSYWEHRTYRSELLPEVAFNGTLPYYSKSYNQLQKEDGSYTYVSNDYSRIDGGLSITQNIPWTGGTVSIKSSLERLQQYGENGSTRFMSVPASIRLDQPIGGFNRVRWLQRIEPVKFKEARLRLVSEMEQVAVTAIEHYFNLLLGQINLEIARQNLANSEKLFHIAQAKREIGQMSETDLQQLKISLLKAESAMIETEASLNARMFQLRSFLGYGEEVVLKPEMPEALSGDIPVLSYGEVLGLALENNAFTQNIQKRILEASREVSRAKADRWGVTLYASYGYSGQEKKIAQAYNSNNLRGDQEVRLGVSIPLLDWGKRKGNVAVAKANLDVLEARIEKEQLDFNQDIFLRVQNFNNQPLQLQLASETDRIAQQRYMTSVEAFILGKIDVLNLNDSQSSKDEARRNYIEQLFRLWSYYYQLRSLTLFDFASGRAITVDYDSLVN